MFVALIHLVSQLFLVVPCYAISPHVFPTMFPPFFVPGHHRRRRGAPGGRDGLRGQPSHTEDRGWLAGS